MSSTVPQSKVPLILFSLLPGDLIYIYVVHPNTNTQELVMQVLYCTMEEFPEGQVSFLTQ